jgi:hypothetical protein
MNGGHGGRRYFFGHVHWMLLVGICVGAALTIGGDLLVKLWLTRWIAAQAAAAAAHVRFWHFAGVYVGLALAQAALDSGKDLYFRVVQVRQTESASWENPGRVLRRVAMQSSETVHQGASEYELTATARERCALEQQTRDASAVVDANHTRPPPLPPPSHPSRSI